MANEIIKYLLESQPDMKDYLSNNPYYSSGVSLAQSPTPVPQSNWEAALMPLAKGALIGGLTSYGKQDAYNTAYHDYADNNILKALTNAQSGTNYQQEMPAGWSPQKGKTDLLFALLAKENESTTQAANAKAIEEAKLKMLDKGYNVAQGEDGTYALKAIPEFSDPSKIKDPVVPGLEKIPKNLIDTALKEKASISMADTATESISSAFDEAKNLGYLAAKIPVTEASTKLAGLRAQIMQILQQAAKGNPSEKEILALGEGTLPIARDLLNKDQLEQKKKNMLGIIARTKTGTPLLDAYGYTPEKPVNKDAAREEMKRIDEALKKRGA